jgi:hypothetical protein
MNPSKQQFTRQLDELILLFRRLQNKAVTEGFYHEDTQMFDSFDQLVTQYETMRHMVPPEFINEMGEPIKSIIEDMIVQLRTDLGVPHDAIIDTCTRGRINEIDGLLGNGNLSVEEMDNLLDERTRLQSLL